MEMTDNTVSLWLPADTIQIIIKALADTIAEHDERRPKGETTCGY